MAAANSTYKTCLQLFFAQAIIVQRNATNIVAILLFCRYSQFYIQLAYRATIPFTVKSKNPCFSLSLNKKAGMLEGLKILRESII